MTEAVRFTKRYGDVGEAKSDGATYTPRALADFVADRILATANLASERAIKVLDPAIGLVSCSSHFLTELMGLSKSSDLKRTIWLWQKLAAAFRANIRRPS